jgi:hypothetical protein
MLEIPVVSLRPVLLSTPQNRRATVSGALANTSPFRNLESGTARQPTPRHPGTRVPPFQESSHDTNSEIAQQG